MNRSEIANNYADEIINHQLTIREVAKKFKVSKSKVHKYISQYVTGNERKNSLRYQLDKNIEIGHIKGGLVSKERYRILGMKS